MDNIFENIGPKLYERGLPVIPIASGLKFPQGALLLKWQEYCDRLPTEEEFDLLKSHHKSDGIGLCLGPASGMVAVDFDYDGPHAEKFEKLFRKALNYNSPIEKRGKLNKFTLFYKYHPDITNAAIDSTFRNADDKAIRFVDILASGKQTVLPPSIHPDTKNPYFYTHGNLEKLEIDELPIITLDEIKAIRTIASMTEEDLKEIAVSKQGNRHDGIVAYSFKIIDYCKTLEAFSEKLFDFDKKTNADKSYFQDKKYRKNMAPEVFCLSLAKRIYHWVKRKRNESGHQWDFGKKKAQPEKLKADYDSFEIFFKETVDIKRDILTGQGLHKLNGNYENILNYLGDLRSMTGEHGLSRDVTADHLARYLNTLKPQLLLDIPQWDGVDRITQVAEFINIKNMSKEIFVDLYKEWAANIFRRLDNPMNQNKLIIFKGDQGKGKDYFISQLLKGFDQYYANIAINTKEAENYIVMHKKLVLNISEFDQVHRLHKAVLKDLITKDSAELRLPYAHASSELKFRCSFIASCNPDEILTDPTGNRRFMIFEIDDINWEYPKGQETQLLAQYHHLYKTGYKANKENVKAMDLYIGHHTPYSIDEIIIEMYLECYANILGQKGIAGKSIKLVDMMPALDGISRSTGTKTANIISLLKRRGYTKHRNNGTHCFALRLAHSDKNEDNIGDVIRRVPVTEPSLN